MADRLPILIVEDDEIHGLNLSAAAEDRDCVVIGPVLTVAEALTKLGTETIGGAILDASLIDRDVTPVAMELIDRAIPFVIHTGIGLPAELATVFPHVSVIMKPTDPDEVIVQLLSQIHALRTASDDEAGITIDPMGAAQDRKRQIRKIAATLSDQFGEKAIVLARRQAAGAKGDILTSWLDIIDALGKVPAVHSGFS